MNIKSHLISAAAALVMTSATFASISGYATHVADAGHKAAAVQLVAANTQPDNTLSLLTPPADEIPTVTVIAHKRAA